jgi:hypothetical protein
MRFNELTNTTRSVGTRRLGPDTRDNSWGGGGRTSRPLQGTSLIRERTPPGLYRRPIPHVLEDPGGGGLTEVALQDELSAGSREKLKHRSHVCFFQVLVRRYFKQR